MPIKCDMENCRFHVYNGHEETGHCEAIEPHINKNRSCETFERRGAQSLKKLSAFEAFFSGTTKPEEITTGEKNNV